MGALDPCGLASLATVGKLYSFEADARDGTRKSLN